MFSTDDSIVAIATPPGRGGIGVVRISGPKARAIAEEILDRPRGLEPRVSTFARMRAATGGAATDEVLATYFPTPRSYTGEDVLEISAHGSPVVLRSIVLGAIRAGARLAEPGEFTLRAFLNGKRDLVRAEAVRDLIDAATPLQARVAFDQLQGTLTERIAVIDARLFDLTARLEASLDFPDEGYHFVEPTEITKVIGGIVADLDDLLGDAARGRMIREGATVVIAGRPNVGKSSMFNALAGVERAIVTPVAGTTRDLVTERVEMSGIPVTLVDTAGWRETTDVVEREGVLRGERARAVADLALIVVDESEPLAEADFRLLSATAGQVRLVVGNKCDLAPGLGLDGAGDSKFRDGGARADVSVSARTGAGFNELRAAIARELTQGEPLRDTVAVSNTRHIGLLGQVRAALQTAGSAAAGGVPEEFVLTDLQVARGGLGEIVGTRTSEDVLRHIFEQFCIGK
jgi:tRNA modification GTPase